MTDYTSIQTTKAQKDELDDLKEFDRESYKDVLQRLIDFYNDNAEPGGLDEARAREIAREEINDAVVFEALE